MQTFHVEIIKPSHYDKDGYVIQWWKAWIPSNSMASLYAISQDCAARKVLGEDVAIEVDAYDEMNIRIPVEKIAAKIRKPGHGGLVCLVGVQSNQFPRAMAIARQFRQKGVDVAVGGFHVSGCISMLKKLTPELKEAVDLGIVLFAGEAEVEFESFLKDVHGGRAKPLYNHMDALPNLQGTTIPISRAASCSATTVCCPPSTPGAAARSNAPSAPSSTSKAGNPAGATPTTSSGSSRRTRSRASRASSSPTTTSPATATGNRFSTA